jgi:hypothetical protein
MNNPVTIEIKRQDDSWDLVEVMPVWVEQGHEFVSTGSFRLYRGYPEFDSKLYDAEAMRKRYLENIELQAEAHPGYLGLLHFKGVRFFEWKYEGHQLVENEVWQLVDCIQDYTSGKGTMTEHGFPTQSDNAPKDIDLYFRYGKDQRTFHIRIEEMEGQFIVLINGEPAAKIDVWKIGK